MPDDLTPTAPRRLQLAYAAVFGTPDKRSTDQALVWADIESFCYAYRPIIERDNLNRLDDETRKDVNEGRRSFWLRARGQVLLAMTAPAKPKISRKETKA
jgi:hypothetical protein